MRVICDSQVAVTLGGYISSSEFRLLSHDSLYDGPFVPHLYNKAFRNGDAES
jgi:hypothetical protein